jgi:16S rRNA U516 pseudouridylate synthase RsuA-like enzyme
MPASARTWYLHHWCRTGKVRVNGETIYNGAATIPPGASVTIKGRVVTPGRPTILYAVNKLQGELVTSIDPQGRPTLLERLKKMGVGKTEHLKPVVRYS